jgi:uncharacterized protein
MNIASGLKAAAKALASGPKPESFRIGGKQLVCLHCENILFFKRSISMNTAFSALTGMQWANKEACALVCAKCAHIEWFEDDRAILR